MPATAGGGTLHNEKTSRQARETFPDQPRRQFGLERIVGRDLVLPQRFLDDAGQAPTAAARPTPPPRLILRRPRHPSPLQRLRAADRDYRHVGRTAALGAIEAFSGRAFSSAFRPVHRSGVEGSKGRKLPFGGARRSIGNALGFKATRPPKAESRRRERCAARAGRRSGPRRVPAASLASG